MKAFLRLLSVLLAVCFGATAQAATSIVTFPDLPSGDAWVTGLTTLFVSAAGLGLGILGLRFVISMIVAGLARRKGK